MTTTRPRGRAASFIRPGLIVKKTLMGELPLETNEFVFEAAIVDLFNAYKRQLREYNQLHEKSKHIKGMHYRSFYTMFRFAQLLHLVEFVREEEADWKRKTVVTAATSLIRLERSADTRRITRRISNRRVFRLSDVGREDVKSWLDLTTAWKEQWPAPQIVEIPVFVEKRVEVPVVEVAPVEAAPPKAKRVRRPKAVVEAEKAVPTLRLKARPSKEQYILLLSHLHKLNELGIDNRRVQGEIDKLANMVGEWVAETYESIQDAQDLGFMGKVREFKKLRDELTTVDEGLLDRDIPRAIEELEKLV